MGGGGQLHQILHVHKLFIHVQGSSIDPVTVGVAKRVAAILEYNTWTFSMDHKYRERVCSSFAVNRNE